ncbi:MAG: MotA/TolQ/ExbB proton channel family protein [Pseudomonadota bacterium]
MNKSVLIRHTVRGLLAGLLALTYLPLVSLAQPDVEQSLLADIDDARTRLAAAEQRVAAASVRLSRQLGQAQQQVLELRREAAEFQRAADDQTLGLEVLQSRVEKWQEQDNYQRSLLLDYGRRTDMASVDGKSLEAVTAILRQSLVRLDAQLSPGFGPTSAIDVTGQAVDGQALSVGPLTWFVHAGGGGLLTQEKGVEPRLSWSFEGEALASLQALTGGGRSLATLDPTQGRYLELQSARQGLAEHLQAGGVWVVPIMAFALLSLVIALIKVIQFLRLPRMTADRVTALVSSVRSIKAGDASAAASHPAPLNALVELATAPGSTQQKEDQLFDFLLGQRHRLQRLIGAVAITATVSPLLGLLGTVSGMIRTFQSMTVFGSGDPAAVSGGISEALVTTELGLVVAVPSLIAHALLKRKADSYGSQLESTAVRLAEAAG